MMAADKPARTVTKISSCRVYAVSRWGTEQPGSSFGLILLLFLTKIEGGHAHRVSSQGKSPAPKPQWQPCCVAGVKRERGGGHLVRARAREAREEGDISLSLHTKNYPFPFPFQSLPCRIARQALKMEEETEKWDVHCILIHAPVFTIFLHKLTLSGTWPLFFFPVRHSSNSMTASLFQAFR